MQDDGGTDRGGYVPHVLVACPKAKNGAPVLNALGVGKPATHDGCANGPACGLEEPEDEVHEQHDGVAQDGGLVLESHPEVEDHPDEADSASPKANSENRGWAVRVAKAAGDERAYSVGRLRRGGV